MIQNTTTDPNKKLKSLFGAIASLDPTIKNSYNEESFASKFSKAENLSALYDVLEKKYPRFKETYNKDSFVNKFRNDRSPLVDPSLIGQPTSDQTEGNVEVLSNYTDALPQSKEIAKKDTEEAINDYESYSGKDPWVKKDKFLRAKEAVKVSDKLNNDFISMQTGQMNWQNDWAKSEVTVDNLKREISSLEDSIQLETNPEKRDALISKKESFIDRLRNEESTVEKKYNTDYFNDLVNNKQLEFKLREEEKALFPDDKAKQDEVESIQAKTDEESKNSYFDLPGDLLTYGQDWYERKAQSVNALRALFNDITGDESEAARLRVGILKEDQFNIDKNLAEIASNRKGAFSESYVDLPGGVKAIISKGRVVGARDSEGYQVKLTEAQQKEASALAASDENIKVDNSISRAAYSAIPSAIDMAEQIGLLFVSGGVGKATKLFDLANKPAEYALNGAISFYQMYGAEYADALSNGYNPDAARTLAVTRAATTSLLEAVNPLEIELAKAGLDLDFNKIRTGVTGAFLGKNFLPQDLVNNYIVKVLKEAASSGKKEAAEEIMQGYFSNLAGNAITGNSEDYTFQDALNDGVPAAILGSFGGGFKGYSEHRKYKNNFIISDIIEALDDPKKLTSVLDDSLALGKISKEDHSKYLNKFNQLQEELTFLGELDDTGKAKAIALVLDKQDLEEELKVASTDKKRTELQAKIDKLNSKLEKFTPTDSDLEEETIPYEEAPRTESADNAGEEVAPEVVPEEDTAFDSTLTGDQTPDEVLFESENGMRVIKKNGFSIVQRKLASNKWINEVDQESDAAFDTMEEYFSSTSDPFVNSPHYTKPAKKVKKASKDNPNRISKGERITFTNREGTKTSGEVTKINKDDKGKIVSFVLTDYLGKQHTLLSGDNIFSDPEPTVGDVFSTSTGEEFTVTGFNQNGEVLFTNSAGVKGRVSKDTFVGKVTSGVLKRKRVAVKTKTKSEPKPKVKRGRKITKEAEDLLSVSTPPSKINPQLIKIAAANGIEIIPDVTTPADIIARLKEIKGVVDDDEASSHPQIELEGEEEVPSEPVLPPTDDPLKDPVSDMVSANNFVNEHLSGIEGQEAIDKLEAVKISVGNGSRDSSEKSLIYAAINRAEKRINDIINAKKAKEEADKRKEEAKDKPKQPTVQKPAVVTPSSVGDIEKSKERLAAEESLLAVEEAEALHDSGEIEKITARDKIAVDLNNRIQASGAVKDVNVTDKKSLLSARKRLESVIKKDDDRRIKEYSLTSKKKNSLEGMQEDIARTKEGEEAFVWVHSSKGVFSGGEPDGRYKKINGVWSILKREGASSDYFPVENQQEVQEAYEATLGDAVVLDGITYRKSGNSWRYFHPDVDAPDVRDPSKIKALNALQQSNVRLNSSSGPTGRTETRRSYIEGVINSQIPNVVKALEKLIPNLGIQLLTNDVYAALADEDPAYTSRGFYHNGNIYINLDKAIATTLYHEATHAAVGALFGFSGKGAEFVTQLHKSLSEVLKVGNDFERSLAVVLDQHAEEYLTAEGVDDLRANEYIAELAAVLASTKSIVSKPSTLDKIIKVINDVLEKFTNLRPIKEGDVNDMIDFMNGLSTSLREGTTLEGKPISTTSASKLKQIIGEKAARYFAKAYHLTSVVDNLDMAKEMYKSFMLNLKSPAKVYPEPRTTTFINFETGEEVEQDTHKVVFIDYPDGGQSTVHIYNNDPTNAIIRGIYAPSFSDKIKTVRGTGMYVKVLNELGKLGITTVTIPSQSADSRFAINRLLENEVLYDPSMIYTDIPNPLTGESISYPTKFEINATQVALTESMLPRNEAQVIRYIKRLTSWELDTDGFWKHELLDNYDINMDNFPYNTGITSLSSVMGSNAYELFNYYPVLREYNIQYADFNLREEDVTWTAGVDYDTKVIKFNKDQLDPLSNNNINPQYLKDILIHEIQHIIQLSEGFPLGGNDESNPRVADGFKEKADELIKDFLDDFISLPFAEQKILSTNVPLEYAANNIEYNYDESADENIFNTLESLEFYSRLRYMNRITAENAIRANRDNAEVIKDIFMTSSLSKKATELVDFLTMSPYNIYKKVAGESEARNATRRQSMRMRAQRDFHLLRDTDDVDPEFKIKVTLGLENSITELKQIDNMYSRLEELGEYIEPEEPVVEQRTVEPSNKVKLFQKDNPPRTDESYSENRTQKKMNRLRRLIESGDLSIEDVLDLVRRDSDFILGDVKELYESISGPGKTAKEYLDTTSNARIDSDIRKAFIKRAMSYLNGTPSFSMSFTPKTIEEYVTSALERFSPDGTMRSFRESVTAFINLKTSSKYSNIALDPQELVALWLYKGLLEKDLTNNELIFKNEAELIELKKQFQVDVLMIIANGTSSAGAVLSLTRHLSNTLAWDEEAIIDRFTKKYEKENGGAPPQETISKLREMSKKVATLEKELAYTLDMVGEDFDKARTIFAEKSVQNKVSSIKKTTPKSKHTPRNPDPRTAREDWVSLKKVLDGLGGKGLKQLAEKLDDADLSDFYNLINSLVDWAVSETLTDAALGRVANPNTNLVSLRKRVSEALELMYGNGIWPPYFPRRKEDIKADIARKEADIANNNIPALVNTLNNELQVLKDELANHSYTSITLDDIKTALIVSSPEATKVFVSKKTNELAAKKDTREFIDKARAEANSLLAAPRLSDRNAKKIYRALASIEHYINSQRRKTLTTDELRDVVLSINSAMDAARRVINSKTVGPVLSAADIAANVAMMNTELDNVLSDLKLTDTQLNSDQGILDAINNGDLKVFQNINPTVRFGDVNRKVNDLNDELREAKEEALAYMEQQAIKSNKDKALSVLAEIPRFIRAVKLNFDASMVLFQGHILTGAMSTLGVGGLVAHHLGMRNNMAYQIGQSYWKGVKDTIAAGTDTIGQWQDELKIGFTGAISKDKVKAAKLIWQDINQRKAISIYSDLISDSKQVLRDAAGLVINKPGTAVLTRREEFFQSKWAEKFPVLGISVVASEAIFTTYINHMRVAAFDTYVRMNPEATLDELTEWANFINMTTGVATPTKRWGVTLVSGLNYLLTAPKLYASYLGQLLSYATDPLKAVTNSFNLGVDKTILGRHIKFDIAKKDLSKARVYAYRAATTWGTTLFFMGMYLAIGAADGDDDKEFVYDPADPSFLTYRFGKSRIDITPVVPYFRYFLKLYNSVGDARTEALANPIEDKPSEKSVQFWTNKVTPFIGLIWDYMDDETFGGAPLGQTSRDLFNNQKMNIDKARAIEVIGGNVVPVLSSIPVSGMIKDGNVGFVTLMSFLGSASMTYSSNLENVRVKNYLGSIPGKTVKGVAQSFKVSMKKPKGYNKYKAYRWKTLTENMLGDWLLLSLESGKKPTKEQIQAKENEIENIVSKRIEEEFK